ncbi:Dehydrogenase [Sandaracinus amylolyticus]|uniref:Dehydrogenase n=2 Tax=Sandaracinus amylolyticus TaxID=927083 RepID=A0A0F6YH39_9BACT|nr:Dehydrogenase [Sandaracinus amylolyticus]
MFSAEVNMDTNDKVWLVTGSSRGLGRAIADAVLAAGDRLVATARDPRALDDLVAQDPARVLAVALDVTRAADARRVVDAAVERFGRIDVLVNNAGYANSAAIEDVDEDDFRAQLETNFFGVFHVTRAVLPVMRRRGSGHIVQISSIGGRLGSPGLGAYQSAKWAVEGLTEVLAREVTPLGIRTTIVEPGGMRTDWAGSSMQVHEPSAPYRATVGVHNQHTRESRDMMRGDPAKAAQAILRIVSVAEPPLRLLLGTDAVHLAEWVAQKRAAEDARWKDLASSTDFDGMAPFATTELGRSLTRGGA